jgi:hypothetical protein
VARYQSAPAFQVLTYISIGFLYDLIYPAGNVGVGHNMLLICGIWAHDRLQRLTGGRGTSERRIIRTLATKCWYNGSSVEWRHGAGWKRRIETGLKTGKTHVGRLDVTRVLREFTTNYTFQRDVRSISSFSGIVTGSFGWSAGQRLRVRQ